MKTQRARGSPAAGDRPARRQGSVRRLLGPRRRQARRRRGHALEEARRGRRRLRAARLHGPRRARSLAARGQPRRPRRLRVLGPRRGVARARRCAHRRRRKATAGRTCRSTTADAKALEVDKLKAANHWLLAIDFRPHSHHFHALAAARKSKHGAGTIDVGGAKVCLFFTSWGDGVFPVYLDLDAARSAGPDCASSSNTADSMAAMHAVNE